MSDIVDLPSRRHFQLTEILEICVPLIGVLSIVVLASGYRQLEWQVVSGTDVPSLELPGQR